MIVADIVAWAVIGAMATVIVDDVVARAIIAVRAAGTRVLRAGSAVAVVTGVVVADIVAWADIRRGGLPVVLGPLRSRTARIVGVLCLVATVR